MFVLFTLVVPFTGLCTDTLTFEGLLSGSEVMAVFHIDTLTFLGVIEYFFLRRWQCYIFNMSQCFTFFKLLLLLWGKLCTYHAGIEFIYTVRLSGVKMG